MDLLIKTMSAIITDANVKKPRASKKIVVVEEPVVVVVEEPVEEPVVGSIVTKETVNVKFDEIIALIDSQIELIKTGNVISNQKMIAFLRNLKTRQGKLKKESAKITKGKTKRVSSGTLSGFLKPVVVSEEIRKFAGWEKNELKSRVCVTKAICSHIKTHNLQNPEDRRLILPDEKLRKILGIAKGSKEPLQYFAIQKLIKHHFTNPVVAE